MCIPGVQRKVASNECRGKASTENNGIDGDAAKGKKWRGKLGDKGERRRNINETKARRALSPMICFECN